MSHGITKPLRFAALIRVSTEAQERKGESLRTQTKQIEESVRSLGGTLAVRYAGQEHATEGYERQMLDQLLAEAAKAGRTFDAVMVADPSRWSRDNVKSETGLDALRDAGVKFYVLTTEYSLYDPQARLILATFTVFNQFGARIQRQKSTLNRINRLRRNIPSAGQIPFGRTFDWKTEEWGIKPDEKALIEDVAARYLAGESLPDLAKEYFMNHSQLCLTLRERCGDQWRVKFDDDALNIHEEVTLTVPRLLDEPTIKRVRQKLEANRTYIRHGGRPTRKDGTKTDYLVSGYIFCAA
jgi:DNA invertase Pin-like site-specific DNA recombinase